jgi:hypothetical protein
MSHWYGDFRANYTNGNWEIHQFIQTLGFYNIEGTFDEVISFLQKKKEECSDYLKECTIRQQNCVPDLRWKPNVVVFDKIHIVHGASEDGGDEIQIWGFRKPNAIELEWLETDRLNKESLAKEERRKQFDQMKAEFEKSENSPKT